MSDIRRRIYNDLSQDYDAGSFEDFTSRIENEESRKKVYNALSEKFDMGSFDEFSKQLGFGNEQKTEPTSTPKPSLEVKQDNVPIEQSVSVAPTIAVPTPKATDEVSEDNVQNVKDNNKFGTQFKSGMPQVGSDAPTKKLAELNKGTMSIPKINTELPTMEGVFEREQNLKDANRGQVSELAANIEQQLNRRGEELDAEAAKNPIMMQAHGTVQSIPSFDANRTIDPEYRNYNAAKKSLEAAQNMIDAADANAEGEGFFGGVGRGFSEKFFDLNTYDMGMGDLSDNTALLKALDAYDKGELTPSQQALLDAKAVELATAAYFGSEVGRGYKAGKATAESIPFMIEMAINPAKAVGQGLTQRVARFALDKFGKKKALQAVTKGVGRAVGDLMGASAMTATTGAIRTAADAARRMQGDIDIDIDKNGEAFFAGHTEGDSLLKAAAKAFANTTIENYSEMVGEYFAPVIGKGTSLGRKALDKVHLGKVNDFIDNVAASDVARAINQFENYAKWNGTIGEFAEEMVGGALNAAIVGDQKFDNSEEGIFNAENMADTALSVGLMGGFFSSIKTTAYPFYKIKSSPFYKIKAKRAVDSARVDFKDAFGDKPEFNALDEALSSNNPEQAKIALAGVLADESLKAEDKEKAVKYAQAIQRYNGAVRADQKRREELQTPEQNEVEASYEQGYDLNEPQQMNDAQLELDAASDELRRVFGLAEDEDIDAFLGDDPLEGIMLSREMGANTEEQYIKLNYLNAKAKVEGMYQKVRDDIYTAVEQSNKLIESRVNKKTHKITPATLKAEDRQVYIVTGNVVMFDDGSAVNTGKSSKDIIVRDANTGKLEMLSSNDVLRVDASLDPEEEATAAANIIREEYATTAANKIDGVVPFAVGDEYAVVFDDGTQHTAKVVADNGDGNVQVQIDNEPQATVATKEQVQQMVNAANKARIAQSKQSQVAEQPIVEETQEVAPEQTQEVEQVAQPQTEEATQAEQAPRVVPMLKDGVTPDFNAMDSEMFVDEYVSRYGEDNAVKIARKNIAAAKDNIAKIDKKIDDVLDPNQMGSLYAQRKAYEDNLNRYNDILGRLGASEDANETEADQQSRLKKEAGNRIASLFPNGMPNVESFILADIATGNRLRWSDKTANGAVTSKGLGAELGLSEAERRKRLPLIGKEAMTPEEYAESLKERLESVGIRYDESSLRDAVLNVYSSVDSRNGAWKALESIANKANEQEADTDWESMQQERAYKQAQSVEENIPELPNLETIEEETPISEGEYAEMEAAQARHAKDSQQAENDYYENEYVKQAAEENGMTVDEWMAFIDEYVAQYDDIKAIFAEAYLEYEQLNQNNNEQGTGLQGVQQAVSAAEQNTTNDNRGSEVLPTEQSDTDGGVQQGETERSSDEAVGIQSDAAVSDSEAQGAAVDDNYRFRTTEIEAEKRQLQEKIKNWLSDDNVSWAEGRSLKECIAEFGNDIEPIAIMPSEIKDYFPELKSLYLYSGKGYLIDHAANHHPELAADEYDKIQEVLDSYSDIKDVSTPNVKKIAFVKMLDKGFAVVTELAEKDGIVMLHKTFFYKDAKGKRIPYENKPSILKKSPVDGSTTISPAKEKAAGRHRNISALDVSESKDNTSQNEKQEIEQKNTAESDNYRFRSVYHGSGADFDKFDHSFMGTGEGHQAFGWGTYVTEVEGIGKQYARMTSKPQLTFKGEFVNAEGFYNPWRIVTDLYKDNQGKLREMRAKAERYSSLVEEDNPKLKALWEDVKQVLATVRSGDLNMKPARHLYSVEIPDDNGSNYIYWDKVVSNEAIDNLQSKLNDVYGEDVAIKANLKYGQDGEHLYKKLERVIGDKAASQFLNENGYVGIIYPADNGKAKGANNYVIFNEADLDVTDNIRFRSAEAAPTFYSNAEYAVKAVKQEKATPEQWLKMIEKNGGLKAGEDKWLGLSDWLKAADKKTISKQEVLHFIKENEIQIEEVEYSNLEDSERFKELSKEYRDLYYEFGRNGDAAFAEMVERYGDDFDLGFAYSGDELVIEEPYGVDAAESFLDAKTINSTRLAYTTDGLDNKREIALTVPTIESWNTSDRLHFGDAGDGRAVAWVRFGEAADTDGNRVLVIDEVQSKRHQEGREKGYNNPRVIEVLNRIGAIGLKQSITEEEANERAALNAELESLFEADNPAMKSVAEQLEQKRKRLAELRKEKAEREEDEKVEIYKLRAKQNEVRNVRDYDYYETEVDKIVEAADKRNEEIDALTTELNALNNAYSHYYNTELRNARIGVMPAPFEKNWAELAMKRMLRYAAENGFDKVAWTTGEQQAERYSLGAVMQGLKAYKTSPNTYYVIPYNNGAIGEFVKEYDEKELAETFGKEIAVNIITNAENATEENPYEMTGDDLRIGGSGMKAFYDQMLPSFMNKYGKKWGVKVQDITLPHLAKSSSVMHSIDVTDAMRESVMQGQPMFRAAKADFNAQFKDLQSEYDALDKNDEQALNEWRNKKRDVVEGYLNHIKNRFGMRSELVVFNGADEAQMQDAYNKLVDAYAAKGYTNPPTYEAFKEHSMKPSVVATYRKKGDIITFNVSSEDSRNRKIKFASTLFHENAHRIAHSLYNEQELAQIWEEAKDANHHITKEVESAYKQKSDARKGNEFIGKSIGYLVAEYNPMFLDFVRGRNDVSAQDLIKKLNYKNRTGKFVVEEILNVIKDEYQNQFTRRDDSSSLGGVRDGRGSRDVGGVSQSNERDERRGRTVSERQRARVLAATSLAESLGVKLNVIEDVNDITDANSTMQRAKRGAKAWYDVATDQVYFVAPNATSIQDAEESVLHEVVAHKGLRDVVGRERFKAFLEKVYRGADADTRKKITEMAAKNGWNFRVATEEYLASLAERGFEDKENRTFWEKVRDLFMDMLREAKIILGYNINDNDLRYMLWRTYQMQKSKGVMAAAEDVLMQQKLGVGNFRTRPMGKENAEDIRFRSAGDQAAQPTEEMTKEDLQKAIDKLQKNVNKLRQTIKNAKEFRKALANLVAARVMAEVTDDIINVMGKSEFNGLIRQIREANARQDAEKPLERIEEIIADLKMKGSKQSIDRSLALKVQGETKSGVSIAKSVDDTTRQIITFLKNNISKPVDKLNGMLEGKYEEFPKVVIKDIAEHYRNADDAMYDVEAINQEIKELKEENTRIRLQRADLNKQGNVKAADELATILKHNLESISALETERLNTKEQAEEEYEYVSNALSSLLLQGQGAYKTLMFENMRNKVELIDMAIEDVDTGQTLSVLTKRPAKFEKAKKLIGNLLFTPANSLNYLLKRITVNAPNGEGNMYDYFIRSNNGYIAAAEKAYDGYNEFKEELNSKAKDVFGKSYKDAIADSDKLSNIVITVKADKRQQEVPLTYGQAMYLYMVNKMADGKVKLNKMGIFDEQIELLKQNIPAEYIAFADWLQKDFLPKKREKYNDTHLRIFGTQMAAIENYVPMKVKKDETYQEVDGSKQDTNRLPTSITGSIINRKRNNVILDLTTNALDLMLSHGQEMEHWNAYSPVVRDMNALLSNTTFRNILNNRKDGLHKDLMDASNVASEQFVADVDKFSEAALIISKGVTASKIAFRLWTAMKQVLSFPAFIAYSASVKFQMLLGKSLVNPYGAWKWGMENLPLLNKRWASRTMGNEKLAQISESTFSKIIDGTAQFGMMPNALVDAVTCAVGAKAVYDYKLGEYQKLGFDDVEADRRAKIDATLVFNESQQSGEGLFLSKIQANKDIASVAISTFNNSNFGYLRKMLEGLREISRNRKAEESYLYKKYLSQGLNEPMAERLAKTDTARAKRTAYLTVAMYGFLLNIIWTAGSNTFKYAFSDDDDDELKGDLKQALVMAPIRNTAIGSMAESAAQGFDVNPLTLMSDINRTLDILRQDEAKRWDYSIGYAALKLAAAIGTGVDLETAVRLYEGVEGIISDKSLDIEDAMAFVSAPRSQALIEARKPKQGESVAEYQERISKIERRFDDRVTDNLRKTWISNYYMYNIANRFGLATERDDFGRVSIPEYNALKEEAKATKARESDYKKRGIPKSDMKEFEKTPEYKRMEYNNAVTSALTSLRTDLSAEDRAAKEAELYKNMESLLSEAEE